jgi:hypothetical protein
MQRFFSASSSETGSRSGFAVPLRSNDRVDKTGRERAAGLHGDAWSCLTAEQAAPSCDESDAAHRDLVARQSYDDQPLACPPNEPAMSLLEHRSPSQCTTIPPGVASSVEPPAS